MCIRDRTGNGKPYKEPNIGWVGVGHPIGDKMHGCSTGSLEFLMSSSVADVFGASYARRHRGDNGDDAGHLILASDASMDYVLMNPPYSRTRGGQSAFDIAGLSAEERDGCQQRWGRMTRNLPASKKAGMAASFLVLARNKLKPGGKLGFVLPLTAAFAQSWEKTRAMLVTEFENIMAIAVPGSSGGVENMSADTHMSEILLVASKRKQQNGSGKISPVLCIALDQLPARSGEAGEYARMIMQAVQAMTNSHCTITAGKSQLGHAVYFLPQEAGSPWSQLSVNNAEVGAIALKLAKGVLEDLLRHQQWQFHLSLIHI
ncbi:MAG: N-6 DNA methylase, partial [Alphaproteobacteria bacterium]|nr:N-6 DNA methylase [Alphaproteobacteria bacterium]